MEKRKENVIKQIRKPEDEKFETRSVDWKGERNGREVEGMTKEFRLKTLI